MIKIVTMCRQGLVRSVGLADVLKLHFEPVDVIPMGYVGNTVETRYMLCDWANFIVVMEERYLEYIRECDLSKTYVCEVGPDEYGSAQHPVLIDKVWRWCRDHKKTLEINEHSRSV